MIITSIKQTGNNSKTLSIAHRLRKNFYANFYCDWNYQPNTLRIFYQCRSINLKFDSFLEACRFIFKMRFMADAEKLERIQNYVPLKGEKVKL